MKEEVLFSIIEIDGQVAIKASGTPVDLTLYFASIIAESNMFEAIIKSALAAAQNKELLSEIKKNKVFFSEGSIIPQGDA